MAHKKFGAFPNRSVSPILIRIISNPEFSFGVNKRDGYRAGQYIHACSAVANWLRAVAFMCNDALWHRVFRFGAITRMPFGMPRETGGFIA